MQFYNRNQNLIHRNLKERSERVEIVHRGQALALLPLVDCARLFKAEVVILQNIRDGSQMQDKNTVCNANVKLEGDEV